MTEPLIDGPCFFGACGDFGVCGETLGLGDGGGDSARAVDPITPSAMAVVVASAAIVRFCICASHGIWS